MKSDYNLLKIAMLKRFFAKYQCQTIVLKTYFRTFGKMTAIAPYDLKIALC